MVGKSLVGNVLPILFGTALYAFGLHYFVISNQLMEGGVTGVAILLNYSFDLPPSWMTLLLNVPIFLLGWRRFKRIALAYTVLGTVSLSFFLWVMEQLIARHWIVPFATQVDFLLVALYAGVTSGIGLGIVFRFGGTTGGVDIIARIINQQKGWTIGQVMFTFDAMVIGSSLFYIPLEKVLYTLVVVFITTKIIDFIQEGAFVARAFTIISSQTTQLANAITIQLERGVTIFEATGAFSHQSKHVIYCVVYKHEVKRMKTLVKSIDPTAFMIINEVQDVHGEGFMGM